MDGETPEAGAPQTVIFARIKQRLSDVPFEPFRIVTTGGRSIEIPTADHASVLPKLRIVQIADDAGGRLEVHTLHVSSIESLHPGRRSSHGWLFDRAPPNLRTLGPRRPRCGDCYSAGYVAAPNRASFSPRAPFLLFLLNPSRSLYLTLAGTTTVTATGTSRPQKV